MMPLNAVIGEKQHEGMSAFWLRLYFPDGDEPVALIEALEEAGWTEKRAGIELARKQPVGGIVEATFSKLGSNRLGYWTTEEMRHNLQMLGDILSSFNVSVHSEEDGWEPYDPAVHGPRH